MSLHQKLETKLYTVKLLPALKTARARAGIEI